MWAGLIVVLVWAGVIAASRWGLAVVGGSARDITYYLPVLQDYAEVGFLGVLLAVLLLSILTIPAVAITDWVRYRLRTFYHQQRQEFRRQGIEVDEETFAELAAEELGSMFADQ